MSSSKNGLKNWLGSNVSFLVSLLLGAVVLYAAFVNIVYRMDQIEARVEKFEELIISKEVFEIWQEGMESKLDDLTEEVKKLR